MCRTVYSITFMPLNFLWSTWDGCRIKSLLLVSGCVALYLDDIRCRFYWNYVQIGHLSPRRRFMGLVSQDCQRLSSEDFISLNPALIQPRGCSVYDETVEHIIISCTYSNPFSAALNAYAAFSLSVPALAHMAAQSPPPHHSAMHCCPSELSACKDLWKPRPRWLELDQQRTPALLCCWEYSPRRLAEVS